MYGKLAQVYDRIFQDEAFYRQYGRFVSRACRRFGVRPEKTLDIACGTGRLGRHLPGRVEGIDSSPEMIRIARRRHPARRASMTKLTSARYDLAVCAFESLNHLKSLAGAFRSARRALRPGGLYCFDLSSDFRINVICPSYLGRGFKAGPCQVFWLSRCSPGRWESRVTIFEPRGRLWKRYEDRIVEKAFSLAEVRQGLRKAGFDMLGEFGDLKMGPIGPTTERWYFVARKSDGSRNQR